MKKFILCLMLMTLVCIGSNAAEQKMTFEQGIKSSKPMALYLYADWADGAQAGMDAFNKMKPEFSKRYNFVTLDIAKPEAKAFNKMYHIYPNLPYVLLFRDGIRFSRFINMDCVNSSSCFSGKLDAFAE